MTRSSFGALVLALIVGTFAACGGTITGDFNSIPQGSVIDLTQEGTIDWVHWGLITEGSMNRKSGVAAMISDYRLVEPTPQSYVVAYQFADNYNGYTWYDGWPVLAQTNTTTGVWAYQAFPLNPAAIGYGFEISVPADTSPRTLKVYVGAFACRGKLTASLSDGGLAFSDSSLINSGNGPSGVYTLNYKANSPKQTLHVKWTLEQQSGTNGGGNVTLQAAALTSSDANNPPLVTLTGPADGAAYPAPATINLTADAMDLDGTVTNVVFHQDTNLVGQSSLSPYEAVWQQVPAGKYKLTAVATDNLGFDRSSQPAEVFVYGSGGHLTGSVASPPSYLDLTVEGTADWVHLGSVTNTSVERKSSVTPKIMVSGLGTNVIQRFDDGIVVCAWSDGTPTLSNLGTTSGVFFYGRDNGFHISAPADASPRKLKIYVGGYGVVARLEAYLSDLSAPPFLDTSISTEYSTDFAVYEFDYQAASPGQQMIVDLQPGEMFDSVYGNVSFQAATLQGGGADLFIQSYRADATGFTLSFPTELGHSYRVEQSETLAPPTWSTLTNITGTGSSATVSDSNPGPDRCYYRVVVD